MAQPAVGLSDLSLEELSNIQITSASKRAQRLSDAASSVFVITSADIRRSGATSLAEALRLAPNLQVARASASEYAISARGSNSSSANKLLVLIDGRAVYTPLFAGVFWDVQNVPLEDIDRIEVISGPGGTLWGVNAVNGVINVITRPAESSQGKLLAVDAGTQDTRVSARYGGRSEGGVAYRLYASRADLRHTETATRSVVSDTTHHTQAGFRADWTQRADSFSLMGDVYTGRREQPLPGTIAISGVKLDLGTISVSGANLVGRWERRLDGGAAVTLQAYYDRTERTVPPTFADKLDVVDAQLQYSARAMGIHTPTWGAEYRYGLDRVTNSTYVAFLPERLNQKWISLFAQDEIALREDLRLTIGARAEHNDYTGTEFLPTARLAWKWAPKELLWMSASRAVRAPSRLDRDTFVPGQPPFLLRGGPEFSAETAISYELGYRGQVTADLTVSATAFHASYDRLRTQEVDPSFTYVFFANGMEGSTSGLEIWGSYQGTQTWRVQGGFSRLWQDMRLKPGSNDEQAVAAAEGANPAQMWSVRSMHEIYGTELDLTLRHVSALSAPDVPSYTALDLRFGWHLRPGLDFSVGGLNLLWSGHGEFTDLSTRSYFRPAVFAKLEWRL